MSDPFLVPEQRLMDLAATRQGRVSLAGYNYQAAFAVARLASMVLADPLLDLGDWPRALRYDWGEDLDEICGDTVRFTQCKRVATIGQPAALASVLVGFAPKWLWTPEHERDRLRFRLVCSDATFERAPNRPDVKRALVLAQFVHRLRDPAGALSDRGAWASEAAALGHERLFDELWRRFECVYVPPEVVDAEPAGPRLAAEREGLRALLERNRIDPLRQPLALSRLRRLVHDNLIAFEPASDALPPLVQRSPRRMNAADVHAALEPCRATPHRAPPFRLVDRTFLSEQREQVRRQFVARQPDWSDVAHGPDATIKFVERDQTAALEAAVLERIVDRIGRGGRTPALFVTGAPGEGKTTLARRVAARLVDAGQILIADTGVGLKDVPAEAEDYIEHLEALAGFGRPVVLLLDDPLYADSMWFKVLGKLNRPGLDIGVLAATPQFLLDEHRSQLRSAEASTFEMARPSPAERRSIATMYGRAASSNEEDFLVIAMQAAAGVPFHEVIDRLWLTLADGRDLSSARSVPELPWQCRAFLFVCFFSRAYEACPEPLLVRLLQANGGVDGAAGIGAELERMKHFDGWRIFNVGHREATWTFQGRPIAAAHTVIARAAWKQRPLPWSDVERAVVEASIECPEAIRDVARVAVRLQTDEPTPGSGQETFATRLVDRWRHEPRVETRHLCDLAAAFATMGSAASVRTLRETWLARATPTPQGWLAALQLSFLEGPPGEGRLPATLDLGLLVASANFALAPSRTTQFIQRLGGSGVRQLIVARLLDALAGRLTWRLDGFLLSYLMKIGDAAQIVTYLPDIRAWLDEHPKDSVVRTQYLAFLARRPLDPSEYVDAARSTAAWLEEHVENTSMRTQYLSFLARIWRARFTAQSSGSPGDDGAKEADADGQRAALAEQSDVEQWQHLAGSALMRTVEFLKGQPGRRDDVLLGTIPVLAAALRLSLTHRDSALVQEALATQSAISQPAS